MDCKWIASGFEMDYQILWELANSQSLNYCVEVVKFCQFSSGLFSSIVVACKCFSSGNLTKQFSGWTSKSRSLKLALSKVDLLSLHDETLSTLKLHSDLEALQRRSTPKLHIEADLEALHRGSTLKLHNELLQRSSTPKPYNIALELRDRLTILRMVRVNAGQRLIQPVEVFWRLLNHSRSVWRILFSEYNEKCNMVHFNIWWYPSTW